MRGRIIKRIFINFMLLSCLFLPTVALTGQVSAVNIFGGCGSDATAQPDVCKTVKNGQTATDPIIQILKVAIDIMSLLVGIAAVVGILVSGLRMILANGDSNAISTARSSLLYSLVGVGITVVAQGIVVFVLDKIK